MASLMSNHLIFTVYPAAMISFSGGADDPAPSGDRLVLPSTAESEGSLGDCVVATATRDLVLGLGHGDGDAAGVG